MERTHERAKNDDYLCFLLEQVEDKLGHAQISLEICSDEEETECRQHVNHCEAMLEILSDQDIEEFPYTVEQRLLDFGMSSQWALRNAGKRLLRMRDQWREEEVAP